MSRYKYFVENGLIWLAFVLLWTVGVVQGHWLAGKGSTSGLVSELPWGGIVATSVFLIRAALMGKRQPDGTYLWSREARQAAFRLALGLGLFTILLIIIAISGISPWRVSPPPFPSRSRTPTPL
jgi:hypothetical protein